jgi:hypothetical protein
MQPIAIVVYVKFLGLMFVSQQTVLNWFKRFSSEDNDFEDKVRSGRPSELDDEALQQLVESDPRLTTREMATTLGCDHSTIVHHLRSLGKVPELGCWVPHDLTQNHKNQRIDMCACFFAAITAPLELNPHW